MDPVGHIEAQSQYSQQAGCLEIDGDHKDPCGAGILLSIDQLIKEYEPSSWAIRYWLPEIPSEVNMASCKAQAVDIYRMGLHSNIY